MFEIGEEYRRDQLLEFVGSKQGQSGIIWGQSQPDCVIVTSGGRHSKRAGYEDKRKPDGSWEYFGQGETGDQDAQKYANALLIEGQRSVLLFTTREPTAHEVRSRGDHSKQYRFEGVFATGAWEWYTPSVGGRVGDRLLLFHLIPASDSYSLQPVDKGTDGQPGQRDTTEAQALLQELRDSLIARGERGVAGVLSQREYKRGSGETRKYARLRAEGTCECCARPAPFVDVGGSPYLEVHHLHRLADDGPDVPKNVAAVCPNCHREVHHGQDRERLRADLEKKIQAKELALNGSRSGSGK